jgi:hypothetical protein
VIKKYKYIKDDGRLRRHLSLYSRRTLIEAQVF